MVSAIRWRQLEALGPNELLQAYSGSLRDRQALAAALGEQELPDAYIRQQETAFAKLQDQGRPRQDLVGYVAASEDVATRKRQRLTSQRDG